MRPFDCAKFLLESVTGAATTKFCVNTAAAEAGMSLERIARSSAPVFFSPHAVAPKRNPFGNAASEGACVTSSPRFRGFSFPGLQLRRERNPGTFRREPSFGRLRLLRSGLLKSQLQIPE